MNQQSAIKFIHAGAIEFGISGIANVPHTEYFLVWGQSGMAHLIDINGTISSLFVLNFSRNHILLPICRYKLENGKYYVYLLTTHIDALPGGINYYVHHKVHLKPLSDPYVTLQRTGVIDLNKTTVNAFGPENVPTMFTSEELNCLRHASLIQVALKPRYCLGLGPSREFLVINNATQTISTDWSKVKVEKPKEPKKVKDHSPTSINVPSGTIQRFND